MRLVDLEGQLYRYAGEKTFSPVNTVEEADSVMFLCPKCYADNNGPVGTHSIRVDFAGKNVPEDVCMHNGEGNAVWWNASGTNINDLTLTPSIQILKCCGWHGWVTNGETVG